MIKKKILFSFVLLTLILILPITVSYFRINNIQHNVGSFIKTSSTKSYKKDVEPFTVFDKSTNQVHTVPANEFIYSSVACEMPPYFEDEAIKAQAVAAFTYFSNLKEKQKISCDPNLKGADFSIDSKNKIYYMTKEQLREQWKENFDQHYNRYVSLVDSVLYESLQQNNKFIEALYHSISSGVTENISDVFGGPELNYLVSVPSPGDLLAPGYQSIKQFSIDEFKSICNSTWPSSRLDVISADTIKIEEKTKGGMVKKMLIGQNSLSGQEIRKAFSLRSSTFDIVISEGQVEFLVRGYGHGVGMSQYGADYMASQGANYKQILLHYYKNVSICK